MPLFLLNNLPFFWLGLAVILVIIESFTMGLTTIWFALGALISMLLAFFHIPFVWQILIFLILSGILLIFTRPVAVKKFKIGSIKTNSEEIIGMSGLVIQNITPDDKGKVKVRSQIWTAASTRGEPINEGAHVRIDDIRGVTVFVSPVKEKTLEEL